MGRHSAPDDDLDFGAGGSGGVALLERPPTGPSFGPSFVDDAPSVGRHVRADDDLEFAWFADLTPASFGAASPTVLAEPLPGVLADALDEPMPAPVRRRRPPGHGVHATRADAGLLRGHADVRNRAVAAMVVPFVVWAVVFAARGDLGAPPSLYWLLAPIVLAGVALGLVLDLGHRRYPPLHELADDVAAVPA